METDGNSLLKAVYLSRLRLSRLLLEGGAYINESDEHGRTPLMVACRTRHSDAQSVPKHRMVRYLLENGADPNIQDKTGKTALMHACLEQTGPDVLSLLLGSGADPMLEDHSGLSALVYAVNSGNGDVLSVLLDACRAKGKEVIIITTDKLPSGRQATRQYLNVPPPPLPDPEERPCEFLLRTPPQGSSAAASPQPGSPLLGLRDPQGPGSPGPLRPPLTEKRLGVHRLPSDPWTRSPSLLLLQQSRASSLSEETETAEDEPSVGTGRLGVPGRAPAVPRHHSVDVRDPAGLLRALEGAAGGGRRALGRKMSYDGAAAAASPHSASHPDLRHGGLPGPQGAAADCLRQLHGSSLQNVERRRSVGADHYSSDSQLLRFGRREKTAKGGRSSALTESRESPEEGGGGGGLERRGSGALLLDRIALARPGYLPPLNPHAPIPDIGAGSGSGPSFPLGSKAVMPCAPPLPRDPGAAKKTLWRRHSMQSEQIRQLADFQEAFGQ